MATAGSPRMTVEEFLALLDDGIERMLIDGQVRELGSAMTRRNRRHCRGTRRLDYLLESWLERQPEPRGQVVSGEAGFRLNTGDAIGVDVAYVAPVIVAATPEDASLFEGPPTLAVEILSPSDTFENIADTIAKYLAAGTALVWVVDPRFRTVTVYRPGSEPEMFNITRELSGEPHLPGLRVPVAEIFA